MRIGYIYYDKKEEEVKKDLSKGIEVNLGVDLVSLLDTINLQEINNAGNPSVVLALLKQEVMTLLGKIQISEGGKHENREEKV